MRKTWVQHARWTVHGGRTRARVFLRRLLGREPTRAEVAKREKDDSLKRLVTEFQITEDFNSGMEVCPLSFCWREPCGRILDSEFDNMGVEVYRIQLRLGEILGRPSSRG